MIHQVKIRDCFFKEKIAGRKAWELRLNDRNYQIGDYLGLNEIDDNGKETGRFVVEKIVDIVYPGQLPDGALKFGYVILSTVACSLVSLDDELEVHGIDIIVYGGEDENKQRYTEGSNES